MSVTAVIFITFVGLLLIGAPITLSLGAAAMGGMIFSGKPLEGLVEIAYTSVNSFPIMALPAFILSGALMESAGISRRLVAVAEAMACGLPVVISDAVNIWPDVEAADAGLVGPCDVAVTARHMIEILENTGRAADMGRNGITLVRDKYSWDGIAPTLEKAYEDVLAGRNSELTWTPK